MFDTRLTQIIKTNTLVFNLHNTKERGLLKPQPREEIKSFEKALLIYSNDLRL